MQNKTFYNFLNKILNEDRLPSSSISKSVKNSGDFNTLLNGGFIEYASSKTGGGVYYVKNKEALSKYFSNKFPEELQNTNSAIGNINTFRNTKAGKRESQNIILIRGFKTVLLNDSKINLEEYTNKFGTFSAQLNSLKTEKVCFVENLDSYLLAEQVIGKDYVFIHTYGGIGRPTVIKVKAKEILVFPDYDFKGLHNYLLVKSVFSFSELFVPLNYIKLFNKKSRTIKTKQGREQQPSNEVKESNEEIVVKIRTQIYKNKKFLEQQALFKND